MYIKVIEDGKEKILNTDFNPNDIAKLYFECENQKEFLQELSEKSFTEELKPSITFNFDER